jgi:Fe-S-cluster-containing hydrogenase component 2
MMTVKTVRKIVKIDEAKCNGCGVCVPSCAEGALQIIDGKARMISEKYCDGLGACLGECPQGAITIEERTAEEFNEAEAKRHIEHKEHNGEITHRCPSATVREIERREHETGPHSHQPSQLQHWPVQLTLIPVKAPFLQDADVVLTADCVPFAYAGFHQDFLRDNALLVACPKLDDFEAHLEKLTQIITHSGLKSLTVVHMEVPCCSGLVFMAKKAIEASKKKIPFKEMTIGVNGDLKP